MIHQNQQELQPPIRDPRISEEQDKAIDTLMNTAGKTFDEARLIELGHTAVPEGMLETATLVSESEHIEETGRIEAPYKQTNSLNNRNRTKSGEIDRRIIPARGAAAIGDAEGPQHTKAVHQKPGPADWASPAEFRANSAEAAGNGPETPSGQQTLPIN
jgi:hypothetical protein